MIVFLLDKVPEYIDKPWEMAVIDDCLPQETADYLRDNWPKQFDDEINQNYYQRLGPANMQDPIFKEFFEENWNRREEIKVMAHSYLGLCTTTFDNQLSRWNWMYCNKDNNTKLVRDWHTDNADKKIQFILYLGEDTDYTTFEMGDSEGDNVKSLPFKHNRLVFWHATEKSFHRFYFTKFPRKTLNLTCLYNRSTEHYWNIPNEYTNS
jgi:hypothetical protein